MFSFLISFLVKSMEADQNPRQGSSMRVDAYSLVFPKCISMHFLLNVSVCVTTHIVVHYDASTCILKHEFWCVYIDCHGKCIKKTAKMEVQLIWIRRLFEGLLLEIVKLPLLHNLDLKKNVLIGACHGMSTPLVIKLIVCWAYRRHLYLWKFAHGLSMFSRIPEMTSARCNGKKLLDG